MPDLSAAGQQAEGRGGPRHAVGHGQGAAVGHALELTGAVHGHASPVRASFSVTCSTTFHVREGDACFCPSPIVHGTARVGALGMRLTGAASMTAALPHGIIAKACPGGQADARISLYPRRPMRQRDACAYESHGVTSEKHQKHQNT